LTACGARMTHCYTCAASQHFLTSGTDLIW
jgi:hypothetical protein